VARPIAIDGGSATTFKAGKQEIRLRTPSKADGDRRGLVELHLISSRTERQQINLGDAGASVFIAGGLA
jgi:hypothetical protein